MALLEFGSLAEIAREAGAEGSEVEGLDLPGLTLSALTITKLPEPFWQKKAEIYLFGVAVDASKTVQIIPFGFEAIEMDKSFVLTRKMEKDKKVEYLGKGLSLLVPPLKGFLALRLLVVDSDAKARDIAPMIKTVADAAGNKEVVAALGAVGLPQAAAAAFVASKAIEVAATALEKNRDDIVSLFEGYFTATDMIPDHSFDVKGDGASATFTWV
ncbi:hypothetical protein J2X03_003647 [Microbacterium trichothecenolyticum]|uniref:hypothetical protein n=1 Tax=Microbacterium trichothecenolyticum TaxID=69370 RepID=UPI00285B20E9|nr:hypothetical protein [Microbacterium trichothecenolyticum]MDR7113747.1 hypothetical protein [Microbacterium trichothecenolyticum]